MLGQADWPGVAAAAAVVSEGQCGHLARYLKKADARHYRVDPNGNCLGFGNF